MNELRRIDLNLFLTLHALLQEKHVTRAAERLHKSQPAVSHALAQLREHFDDPLLIRQGGKMELTSKARTLLLPLDEALANLNTLLGNAAFNPADSDRRFHLAMSDYASAIILPPLVHYLRTHAPNMQIAVSQLGRDVMLAQLADGSLDLAFSPFIEGEVPSEIHSQSLFSEHFVCVADKAILPENGLLTLEEWLARQHVLPVSRPDVQYEIERAVTRHSQQKLHLTAALPHWGMAVKLISGTDLVLTISSRAVADLSAYPNLHRFPLPLPLPEFPYYQAWHNRKDHDPAHRWLRGAIKGILAEE